MEGRLVMRVVMSAAGADEEGVAACRWCAANLHPGASVTVVVGLSQLGEFVLGVPPFDASGGEAALLGRAEALFCRPLTERGLQCHALLVPERPGQAVLDVAEREHADLIVVGKRPHGPFVDALLGELAAQLVHHPPCPLVVVPSTYRAADLPGPL
jgi:nucleotide-binding universal stress UspA family protein